MKRLSLIFLLACLLDLPSNGQSTNFSSGDDWRRTKEELILGLGVSNCLSDLGGLDQIGTDYHFVDIEWPMTRPSVYFAYRNRLNKTFSWRSTLLWGVLKGDDNLTAEPFRNYRNLHFRTHFWEVSQIIEIGTGFDKIGKRYNVSKKGYKNFSVYLYGYLGVGAMFFNPKAKYEGKWRALQPLGTEGQVAADSLKKYSRFTYTLPIGAGLKMYVGKRFNIGLEFAYRKVGSDYIDDVSGDYYYNNIIRGQQGDMAADLADPSSGANWNWTIQGEQRGDPTTKDAILSAHLQLCYNLTGFNSKGKSRRRPGSSKRRYGKKGRAMF